MIPLRDTWACMIQVTNVCMNACNACVRACGHTPVGRRGFMDLHTVARALDALDGYPGYIGVTGGEPSLHPDFDHLCGMVAVHTRAGRKTILFTSGGPRWHQYEALARQCFTQVHYNDHRSFAQQNCLHQPMFIAMDEAVSDHRQRAEFIRNCWLQRTWSPSITPRGCFICDCAGTFDELLDGPGGYPIEPGWWKREPAHFQDQVDRYCGNCSIALPYPRQPVCSRRETVSPVMLARLRAAGCERLGAEDIDIVRCPIDPKEIEEHKKNWRPWENRQDLGQEG